MLRGQGTNQQEMLPVMARFPETDGDLTFQNWIEIAKDGHKAIKLDFQSIDAVDLSLQVLENYKSNVSLTFYSRLQFNLVYFILKIVSIVHTILFL